MIDRVGVALAKALARLELFDEAKALMAAHDRWAATRQPGWEDDNDVHDEAMALVDAFQRGLVLASYQGLARIADAAPRWDETAPAFLECAADALDSLEGVVDLNARDLKGMLSSEDLRTGGIERNEGSLVVEAARAAARTLAAARLITGDGTDVTLAQSGLIETAVLVLRSATP